MADVAAILIGILLGLFGLVIVLAGAAIIAVLVYGLFSIVAASIMKMSRKSS